MVAALLAATLYYFHSRGKDAGDVTPYSEPAVTESFDPRNEAADPSPEPTEAPEPTDASEPSDQPSSDELIDEWIHASAVKEAKKAGVSTEGTTAEILERIAQKNLEKYGQ